MQPLLSLDDSWVVLEGHAFGARQPVMSGGIGMPAALAVDWPSMSEALVRLLGPLPKPLPAPGSPAQFCSCLLTWSRQLEAGARIPAFEVGQVRGVTTGSDGRALGHVVTTYFDARATLASLKWVVGAADALLRAASPNARQIAFDAASQSLQPLRAELEKLGSKSVNTDRILRAALQHDIPFQHVEGETYLFGHGRRSRWLRSTFTDQTSNLAAHFARRKDLTSRLLASQGLPVAAHALVAHADDAVQRARQLGYPVVVKPADRDGGDGVHAGLQSDEQLRRCHEDARRHSAAILVEKHHEGEDYRVTVLHGRMIKAIQRLPGGVTGDGHQDIRALLAVAATDPDLQRRSGERGKPLLTLDDEAMALLADAGLTPTSVPSAGRFVRLRRRANVSSGGSTRLVTDTVHPDNRRLAERAAQAVRLDVAGVDLILPDIARSWMDTGGIVCEVNAQPQLGENSTPGLYGAFLRELLGGDGRIPVALVLRPDHLGAADLVTGVVQAFSGGAPGAVVVSGGAMSLDGERWNPADLGFFKAARAALQCREADRAVLAATPHEILAHGLPTNRLDLLVLEPAPAGPRRDATLLVELAQRLLPHLSGALVYAAHDPDGALLAGHLPAERRSVVSARGDDSALLASAFTSAVAQLRKSHEHR